MNNRMKFLTVGAFAFVIGMSVNNIAFSDTACNCKIGVVDISKVVSASTQVVNMKKEQQAKAQEIVTFVEKARKDVAAAKDEKTKKSLEEKYNKELTAKKEKMDKDYAAKLKNIDDTISKTVEAQAKAGGFKVVLAKGVVLYGGEDITDAVIKAVK